MLWRFGHPILWFWLQCDVTAVGATVCRHYVIAHLLDISTGERYIYACVMLYILMVRLFWALHSRLPVRMDALLDSQHVPGVQVTYSIPILVVWYDINCKFGGYFMRWAQYFARLASLLHTLQTKFPLPGFHKYCHKWVEF